MNPEEKKQLLKAKDNVYRILKYRLRSEKEIRDKLNQKDFSENIIEKSIAYFKEVDLINDSQFTKGWILSRLNKPYGLNRIRFELRAKGIDKEIIEQQIDLLNQEIDEETSAKKLVKKRQQKYKNLSKLKIKQRLYGYLSRRGFDSYTIHKAMSEL